MQSVIVRTVSAYSEAIALQDALPRTGSVPWEIGKVYNALLAAAKLEKPDTKEYKEKLERATYRGTPTIQVGNEFHAAATGR